MRLPTKNTRARIVILACLIALLGSPLGFSPAIPAAQANECFAEPCAAKPLVYLPLISYKYPIPETVFGVQMYGPLDIPAAGMDLARNANVSWIRTQMSWGQVEPVNVDASAYDFTAYDGSLLSSAQKGIRPIVTILSNPSWAATYSNGPIDKADLEQFGQFIGAAVERYDGDGFNDAPGSPVVRYWEFYNEPDSGDEVRARYGQAFWGDYGAEYAQMLCVASWYAKLASPQAHIVMGGVAHDWFREDGGPFVESFVDDVLSAGGGKCIDVMNFHFYPIFASRWEGYGPGIIGKTEYFRAKLANYGLNKPFMCTESGWHSDTDGVDPSSPQNQADFVLELFAQSRATRLISNIWWTWVDLGATVGSYGLLSEGLSKKPAYYAYKYAADKIGPVPFVRPLSSVELGHPALEGYLFSPAAPIYVIWSNDSAAHPVTLPGRQAHVLNSLGSLRATITDSQDGAVDERITVSIGQAPMYVETYR